MLEAADDYSESIIGVTPSLFGLDYIDVFTAEAARDKQGVLEEELLLVSCN